jgi:hypothetical protein
MPDLFISYSSPDRVWAERLYNDLRRRFPTIRIFWDRDPASLPPGRPWREVLTEKAENTTHFAVLWSEAAKASDEVGPEIQAFQQNVKTHPTRNDNVRERKLFYIPLEGQYGPLEQLQGFVELRRRGTYSSTTADRGLSHLDSDLHRAEWHRLVRIIGDTVLSTELTQPITLALLVMNQTITKYLDPLLDIENPGGPTLKQFLDAFGLTLTHAKTRYGADAFSWHPFGTTKTIVELMEDVRELANRNLNRQYQFHWMPWDFVQTTLEAKDPVEFRNILERLAATPSAVVIDPISLYHPIVAKVFARLSEYATKEYSIILSLSPNEVPAAECLYQSLLSNGASVLDPYFLPQIPAAGTFARCGINVQHSMDVERLIRGSLGAYYLQRKKSEEKPLLASGG